METLWANLARKMPRQLVYWCVIRVWSMWTPQMDWETHETAVMWRAVQEFMEND